MKYQFPYAASGELIEFAPTLEPDVFVVLVRTGYQDGNGRYVEPCPFVVARYRVGARERMNGTYCTNIVEAAEAFRAAATRFAPRTESA